MATKIVPARFGGLVARPRLLAILSEFPAKRLGIINRPNDQIDHARALQLRTYLAALAHGEVRRDEVRALRLNPVGAKLKPVFGSDIGHWDVPDFRRVLEEAWELVEHGLLDTEGFRDFTFANPVRLWAGTNPGFFKGTSVEEAVTEELARICGTAPRSCDPPAVVSPQYPGDY